ncbi:type II toxin-antitoxin system VapC family toxin [Rubripirellula reticaptiva]|uniref:tRNA(fMet)-specific endonuclease VapC n=1 Tax=Rubripirellula reticaptiva TaxID=2528013 RepID=A0A5C6EJD7_9BACT|nr:type II toxin-antitoxin system VapC family toxin [Rubripirellula reticaptiva]TWU48207.1 tRNA(fMet)-specific endonuclease VapC [Rubripirellula reticaptiva]
MPFLLDTNAWIGLLKNPSSSVKTRIQTLSPSEVVTCSIVHAELRYGAGKYGNVQRRVLLIEQFLAPFRSVAFDDDVVIEYARLRHSLDGDG